MQFLSDFHSYLNGLEKNQVKIFASTNRYYFFPSEHNKNTGKRGIIVFKRQKQRRELQDKGNTSKNASKNTSENVSKNADKNTSKITGNIDEDIKTIKAALCCSPDLVIRRLKPADSSDDTVVAYAVMYIEGLADRKVIENNVIKPLLKELSQEAKSSSDKAYTTRTSITEKIKNTIASVSNLNETDNFDECINEVLTGNTIFLTSKSKSALVFNTPGWKTRNPEEPISEPSVRGSRDGFVETLQENIVRIRRRVRDPGFAIKKLKVGRRTKTDVAVVYISNIANKDLVEEVVHRIEQINIDEMISAGTLEQFIEDNFLSLFPQIQYTERPDRVVAALMEGRTAIILDNTPFVLIVPATLPMFIQSPEDYYDRWIYSSVIRVLRYLVVLFSLFLPSVYIAYISFHQGLIPTKLAIFIASTREGVPLPSLIEALLMETTLEILREAGIRLPKTIGQAVGIVGGLVIGEAAVRAGIVSPVSVVVVALTAIASFSVPQYAIGIPIRLFRFVLMITAGILGLYGVMLAFIMITVHIVRLKSFGVNYMSPFVPYRPGDWKDFIFRLPVMMMKKRPEILKTEDQWRQGNSGKG